MGAVAKRSTSTTSPAARAANALRRLANFKSQAAQSKVPNALMSSGLAVAGAAGTGAAESFLGEEVMGAPTRVVLGVGLSAAGIATGQPWLIALGTGPLAAYVADYTRDLVDNWRSNADTAGPRAVNE